jgi:hypothetical protein
VPSAPLDQDLARIGALGGQTAFQIEVQDEPPDGAPRGDIEIGRDRFAFELALPVEVGHNAQLRRPGEQQADGDVERERRGERGELGTPDRECGDESDSR